MSTTIDQKVVEMRFDNRQFENNVQTTMSTLDKLKQKLNLSGASKGLENVSSAARKVDVSAIGSAVEVVNSKFSAMEVMAVTALANITNSAVNAGKRIVSALAIEPIKTGFQEYETQINAVQTILANTSHAGTDLNDVNAVLDELNEYADRTIYNFTQMTRNIGTFTAAGLGLEESASAIKGIANLAAVSGSTSQQASTAMYQLSQALANGKVNLQDWNSVVNAGMGGKVFQDALVRTAAAMKGVTEETFRANNITGSFRESISSRDGSSWLTADVLSKTLQQFTGDMTDAELATMGFTEEQIKSIQQMAVTANDAATKVKTFTQLWDTLKESAQSGWTQTWELIVGDFEEAKSVLTEVSDAVGKIIGDSAKSRNDLLAGALNTNWEKMMAILNEGGISNGFFDENLQSVLRKHGQDVDSLIEKHGSLAEAFRNGSLSTDLLREAIKEVSTSIIDLSTVKEGLKFGDTGDDIKKVQQALDELDFDIGADGINGEFNKATEGALKAFQEMKGLKVTGIVDEETLKALQEANEAAAGLDQKVEHLIGSLGDLGGREKIIQSFKNIFEGLGNIIKPISESFKEFFPKITVDQVTSVIDGFHKMTEQFKAFTEQHGEQFKSTFTGIFSVLRVVVDAIVSLGKGAVSLISNFTGISGGILDITASIGDWLTNMSESIRKTDIFGKAVEKVVGFLSNIIINIKEFWASMNEGFNSEQFQGFLGFFEALWNGIRTMASKVVELLAPIGDALTRAFGDANLFDILNSGLLGGLFIGMQSFTGGFTKLFDRFKGLIDDMNDGEGFFGNIKGAFEDLRGCFESYQRNLNAETLMKIAKAIALLAASIFVLSTIDAEALDRSVGYLSVLFAELLGSLFLFTKMDVGGMKGITKACGVMTAMSISVLILSGALKVLASIDPKSLINGLIAIGALMAEIALFLNGANFSGKTMGTAVGIVILSSAMLILAKAVEDFGAMEWTAIGKGLAAIGALLVELGIFTRLVGGAKHVASTGVAMVLLGAAMKIFVSVVDDLGNMSWEVLTQGLFGMGVALLELALAMRMMPKDTILIGTGLVVVGAAMKIMADALSDFGNMSWAALTQGLFGMGAALLELAIGLKMMNGSLAGSAALLIAAGALALIVPVMKSLGGMSWEAIGKGLVTLAGAFAVIGVAGLILGPLVPTLLGLAGAFALFGISVAAIGAGVVLLSVGFTALAAAGTAGATAIVAALSIIVVGLLDLIPTIVEKMGELILAVCNVLAECAPQIAVTILTVVTEVLSALATYTPQILESLFKFLIGILDGLAEYLPQLIASAMNLIGAFFQGVADALSGIDVGNLFKGLIGIALMTGLMMALSAVVSFIPGAMMGVIGMGAVIAELALMLAAVGAISKIPGLNWLIGEGGKLLEGIGNALGKFVGGLAGGILEGVTSSLPQIGTDLSDFMTNAGTFIEGAKGIDASMMEGVKALAETILILTAADILSGIASWITGGSSLSDFAEQLVPFGKAMKEYSDAVIGINTEAVTASATAGQAIAELANSLPNSGGVVSWFTGDNDIDAFAEKLIPFGKAMKEYSDAVIGIDAGAVKASATAGKALSELAETLPNSGGAVSWFTGDNDIDDFGEAIVTFGEAITDYCDTISGTNFGSVLLSITAASKVIEFITGLSNASFAGVDSFKASMNTLGSVSIDGFVNAFAGAESKLKSAGVNLIDSIISGIKTKESTFTSMGTTLMTGFINGVENKKTSAVTTINNTLGEILKAVKGKHAEFRNHAGQLMIMFASGLDDKKTNVIIAVSNVTNSAVHSITGYYDNFYSAGSHLVAGFASGISANSFKAEAQAAAMANAAETAAKKALGIKSPSRAFMVIGRYVPEGFAIGIEQMGNVVKRASIGMADTAVTSIRGAVSQITDLASLDINTQPTIRPVLDLSDIRSGAGAIKGLFNNQSIATTANVRAISSMSNLGQNGGNSEVVSAINKLRSELGNVGGNTYQINGVTYDDGSNVSTAVKDLLRAAKIERRT